MKRLFRLLQMPSKALHVGRCQREPLWLWILIDLCSASFLYYLTHCCLMGFARIPLMDSLYYLLLVSLTYGSSSGAKQLESHFHHCVVYSISLLYHISTNRINHHTYCNQQNTVKTQSNDKVSTIECYMASETSKDKEFRVHTRDQCSTFLQMSHT